MLHSERQFHICQNVYKLNLSIKESSSNAGDPDSIPKLGWSTGEGNGNPLQYSYLGNPMDRATWQVTVCGVASVRHDLATKPPQPI